MKLTTGIKTTAGALLAAILFLVLTVYNRDGFTIASFAIALVFASAIALGVAVRQARNERDEAAEPQSQPNYGGGFRRPLR